MSGVILIGVSVEIRVYIHVQYKLASHQAVGEGGEKWTGIHFLLRQLDVFVYTFRIVNRLLYGY